MSKSDDRRREEKERLWNEVMGKNRTYESTEASQEITLTIDANEKAKEQAVSHTSKTKDILKSAFAQRHIGTRTHLIEIRRTVFSIAHQSLSLH